MEGTAVTKLDFRYCSLPAGECAAILASGLARNTSVISITLQRGSDQALGALQGPGLYSTMQELSLESLPSYWSPIFLALGENTGLKILTVHVMNFWMKETLCTVMLNGLGTNATLEHLKVLEVCLCDDTADLWIKALNFFRTSKSLKSLQVTMDRCVTEPLVHTFRVDMVVMLQGNQSLESLSIRSCNAIKAEEYITLVSFLLQHDTTLKALNFVSLDCLALEDISGRLVLMTDKDSLQLLDYEYTRMIPLLKKN
jgi:hypothetical protein